MTKQIVFTIVQIDLRLIWRGGPDRLYFSVNKPATFYGVYLFGDDKRSKYEVTLEVDGTKVTDTYTSECNSEGVYGFNVMLPMSISIEESKIVEMAATISEPGSYSFVNGGGIESVEVDGVKVTFSNATASRTTNGTSKSRGQFYEIILSSAG